MKLFAFTLIPFIVAGQQAGAYRVGGGVSAPRVLSKPEPEYSEEARRAKVKAAVVLSLVVGPSGEARDVKVVRGAGFGLEEQAIATVKKWRFAPGEKEGVPVSVMAQVEISFRLLSSDSGLSKLTFELPNGASRPELLKGRAPTFPSGPPWHFRVTLARIGVAAPGEAAGARLGFQPGSSPEPAYVCHRTE